MGDIVPRDELEAAIEARKELGSDLEPALVDAFVERIEKRLAKRSGESERALEQLRDHQKEMVLGSLALSIPLFAHSPRSSAGSPASSAFAPSLRSSRS